MLVMGVLYSYSKFYFDHFVINEHHLSRINYLEGGESCKKMLEECF